ncbi:sugar transferase [Brevibacterium sp.]|uniref:sugar transferase n=1 Tax=Brevibacterium sp. TaxID=1701 RepID=UPI002810C93B|nr:sugar transferase [Brevibacterium sp.]
MVDYPRVKRAVDCVGAAAGIVVLSPVLIIVAVLVMAFLGGPVLFTQRRVTKDSRVFLLLKFRSMRPVDPSRGWIEDEDRLTSFGRFLRASSLDELPSLWNVLVGDMSFIGPRPLMPDLLRLYTPAQARRHEVRGGISGLAQVSGRNQLPWDEKFDLDVRYVETLNWRLDMEILVKTLFTVVTARGVTNGVEATTDSYGGTLRSDLVSFTAIERSRTLRTWEVTTKTGMRLGRCEIRSPGRTTCFVSFEPQPGSALSRGGDYDELHREVLRLLVNRARGTDAQFALSRFPASTPIPDCFQEAGFVPVDIERDLPAQGWKPEEELDGRAQYVCRHLVIEESTAATMGLAS